MNQKDFLLSPCTNFQFLPILASDSLLNIYGLPKFLSKGHTGLFRGPQLPSRGLKWPPEGPKQPFRGYLLVLGGHLGVFGGHLEVLGGHLKVPSAQLAATNGYSDIAESHPEAPMVIQRPAMGPKWFFKGPQEPSGVIKWPSNDSKKPSRSYKRLS